MERAKCKCRRSVLRWGIGESGSGLIFGKHLLRPSISERRRKLDPSVLLFLPRDFPRLHLHTSFFLYVFLSSEHLHQPNHQSFQGSRPCEQKQGQSYRPGIAHHRTNCITEERKLERSLFSEIFPIAKKMEQIFLSHLAPSLLFSRN